MILRDVERIRRPVTPAVVDDGVAPGLDVIAIHRAGRRPHFLHQAADVDRGLHAIGEARCLLPASPVRTIRELAAEGSGVNLRWLIVGEPRNPGSATTRDIAVRVVDIRFAVSGREPPLVNRVVGVRARHAGLGQQVPRCIEAHREVGDRVPRRSAQAIERVVAEDLREIALIHVHPAREIAVGIPQVREIHPIGRGAARAAGARFDPACGGIEARDRLHPVPERLIDRRVERIDRIQLPEDGRAHRITRADQLSVAILVFDLQPIVRIADRIGQRVEQPLRVVGVIDLIVLILRIVRITATRDGRA